MAENQFDLETQIRMGMNLIEHDEFSETVRTISKIAADVVVKTLGPYAHTTTIDDGRFTYPTKDGWTILSRLTLQDPVHAAILKMLTNISGRIVDKVGDGTTTAMVTANYFVEELTKALETNPVLAHARQADIVKALNNVRDLIIEDLEGHAIQIAPDPSEESPDYHDIYNVAYISSNGNDDLAKIMQEIYKQTANPNVIVDQNGGQEGFTYEIQHGYRLDASFLMHERYRNTPEGYYDSNGRPHLVVIFDHNVNYQRHAELIDCMKAYAQQKGMPLVIMAPYFDDLVASSFALMVNQTLKMNPNAIPGLMVLQIPEMTRAAQRNAVSDFAVMCNATLVDATKVRLFATMRHNAKAAEDEQIKDPAADLNEYQFATAQELMESFFATAYDFTIGKNFITIRDNPTDSVRYKARLAEVEAEYEAAKKQALTSPTDLMKAYLEASQRKNKLAASIGIIHVGGISDLERSCNMDVVDDVSRACRSAYENGVVAGMNLGTLVSIERIRQVVSGGIDAAVLEILNAAFTRTTLCIIRSRDSNDETYHWVCGDGSYATNESIITNAVRNILVGDWSSYDITKNGDGGIGMYGTERVPAVCNSVATDVEILRGMTSILGMILTSDQYLSVGRAYDKAAAMKAQEAINAKTAKQNVDNTLNAVEKWVNDNPAAFIAAVLRNLIPTPLQEYRAASKDDGTETTYQTASTSDGTSTTAYGGSQVRPD